MDPSVCDVKVVFQHEDFLVVEKPLDISMHNDNGSDGFISQLRILQQSDSIFPVHRLDKITSGLLLVARSARANRTLSQLFAERKVEKWYVAISDRKPKKKQGKIVGDMKAGRNGSWILCREQSNPAITHFNNAPLEQGLRVFLLKPVTGKTHQLRVALKSLGSPILGDVRYGGSNSDRAYLHAYKLSFAYDNVDYSFSSNKDAWQGSHFSTDIFHKQLGLMTEKR